MSRTANLVIKLTAGLEAPERVSQAFSVASAALASGINVSFWLTGDAAYFAVPGITQLQTIAEKSVPDTNQVSRRTPSAFRPDARARVHHERRVQL